MGKPGNYVLWILDDMYWKLLQQLWSESPAGPADPPAGKALRAVSQRRLLCDQGSLLCVFRAEKHH